MINMKKKPQRFSYKKLTTTRKPDTNKYLDQSKQYPERQRISQYNSFNPQQGKSSSKNKSAQKILSVYQNSKAKFKIGKFLSGGNERHQRIKTQGQQFQKTKSNYNKINSVRKINNKDKQQKLSTKQIHSSNKPFSYIKPSSGQQKNRNLYDNTLNKHKVFNKRLNLNSQLFDNLNKNSIQRQKYLYQAPQTSKNDKRYHINSNIGNLHSFRKQHESFRSKNKKTALEKYISQSLQNLQSYPSKNKNSKQLLGRNKFQETLSKEKLKSIKQGEQLPKEKYLGLNSSLSKQKKIINSVRKQNSYRDNVFEYDINEERDVIKEQKTMIKSPRSPRHYYQQNSQRRMKTEKDDSIQKIQIKWEKKKKNPYDLSNQQMDTFGDRFPDGFDKLKLLGRGGFSLVWLGEHKKSKKKYAVKQIITQSSHQTHLKQIWFGSKFFQFGGAAKQQFQQHPGIKNLVKLFYYFMNKKDTWILYQKCGDSLGNALYQLKGQQYNGQKVYRIYYKQFYQRLKTHPSQIKKIILQVAKALLLLAENNIVHSDLKTENILVKIKQEDQKVNEDQSKTINTKGEGKRQRQMGNSLIEQVKLIDYGSSFEFNNLRQFSMATPQYMAPQILNFILYQNELQYIPKLFDYVQQYHDPWVIDVWSLGSVILEIISGIPLWMSLKTIVKHKNKQLIRYGLFAVKGRTFDKIIKKQLETIQNLDKYLYEENYSNIQVDDDVKYLLKRMLALNPTKRISPSQIIEFLTKNSEQNK